MNLTKCITQRPLASTLSLVRWLRQTQIWAESSSFSGLQRTSVGWRGWRGWRGLEISINTNTRLESQIDCESSKICDNVPVRLGAPHCVRSGGAKPLSKPPRSKQSSNCRPTGPIIKPPFDRPPDRPYAFLVASGAFMQERLTSRPATRHPGRFSSREQPQPIAVSSYPPVRQVIALTCCTNISRWWILLLRPHPLDWPPWEK